MTLRELARESVKGCFGEAAAKHHEMNYWKLHVLRDGSLNWFETIDKSSDIIDGGADHFAAVRSVITVGTGSYECNCQYCDDGRMGRTTANSEAIGDDFMDMDLSDMEAAMLAEFDRIAVGYFDDEEVGR